ncbi:MAG: DEAD/DEAH box helicase family protein [Nitrososphaera sp.]|jgi:superfamily II DNA or RNA helicase
MELQGEKQQIKFVSALDLLLENINSSSSDKVPSIADVANANSSAADKSKHIEKTSSFSSTYDHNAISKLRFPFTLKPDQCKAVEAWLANKCRGSVIYGSGTGKTEIAFECARRLAEQSGQASFSIVFLVPRIVLVDQNYGRLVRYGISPERIGKFFGEEKQIREITICTYHSALANLEIINKADMVIFDEVHLVRGAFSRIFDVAAVASKGKQKRALLGLTATIDEDDPKNSSIVNLLPPVKRYLIKDAVVDKRLAKPIVFPIRVTLTDGEQLLYEQYSTKIRNISRRLHRYDAREMMALMTTQGFLRWQARAWFLNVKKRKQLLASSENKMRAALDLIVKKHPDERIMVFSETLESIRKLRGILTANGIRCALIESSTPLFQTTKDFV